ncbi:hypothetical protein IJ182_03600 [bacterium]|nr:hypothetical protein [bacterium]
MQVNFNGKVYLAGSTRLLSPNDEVKQLKQFAKKADCDVVVLNRDYYRNGAGTYNTLLVKSDLVTGANDIYSKTFNFINPEINNKKPQKFEIPKA